MKKQQAEKLFEKCRKGILTRQERLDLEGWYLHYARSAEPLQDAEGYEKRMKEMDNAFPFLPVAPPRKIKLWPRIAVAAFILIAVSISLYLFHYRPAEKSQKPSFYTDDIRPGGSKAILTLADGSKISLSDAANGEIARQAGISISKTSNGHLIYSIADRQPTQQAVYNTIETPKGGQYQINLPDGSKVWLNAGSSLRFPATFTGKERQVELTGEAYFEIAKLTNPSPSGSGRVNVPFKVNTYDVSVEVLGTHFNIMAYADEGSINTTLLEGSVKVSKLKTQVSQLLKPGQQAEVNQTIKVFNVDTEEAVAWKNGYFLFQDENIRSIMAKAARWYDVEVEYRGNMEDKNFVGKVSRYDNISELLKNMELTGMIHFKIVPGDVSGKGRRVIVMP